MHDVLCRLLHVGDGHFGHTLGTSALGGYIIQAEVERLVLVVTIFLGVLSLDASMQEEEDESGNDYRHSVLDMSDGYAEDAIINAWTHATATPMMMLVVFPAVVGF